MGREQGDHLDEVETTWYVGRVNGVEHERPASTPAEHINVRARGWVTKASLGRPNTSAAEENSTGTPTTSPSGSEPASSGQSTPADSPSVGPSTPGQQSAETEAPARRGGRRAPEVASAAPQDEAAGAAGGNA